jgi:hypothetical protein
MNHELCLKNDKASNGRILYLNYNDYIDKWDEVYSIFSKEGIFKGAFDQYAESAKQKHETQEVDVYSVELKDGVNFLLKHDEKINR